MHNPKTIERVISIVVWPGVGVRPQELKVNHEQWSLGNRNRDSFHCVQGTTLSQPRLLIPNLIQDTKSMRHIHGVITLC